MNDPFNRLFGPARLDVTSCHSGEFINRAPARNKKISDETKTEMKRLRLAGIKIKAIASLFKISQQLVSFYTRDAFARAKEQGRI